MTDITPARLRELADALELYRGLESTLRLALDAAAALRAAAYYIDRLLELRASDAQMIGDAHGLVRAREALLAKAKNALTVFCKVANVIDYFVPAALPGDDGRTYWPVLSPADDPYAPSVRVDPSDYLHARALAAEIAEALNTEQPK